jgi:hypothetical protein
MGREIYSPYQYSMSDTLTIQPVGTLCTDYTIPAPRKPEDGNKSCSMLKVDRSMEESAACISRFQE